MTKQVSIAGGALRLNETELAALRLVAARAGQPGAAVQLPLSAVCEATGVSEAPARRAVRSLVAGGLLSVEARYGADGGQRANAYALTQLGALAAAAAPAAPAAEPAQQVGATGGG